MVVLYIILCLIECIIMGVISQNVASRKGHPSVWWFFNGFILNIVGLIFVALLKDNELQDQINNIRTDTNNLDDKYVCIKCGAINDISNNYCCNCGVEKPNDFNTNQSLWKCPNCSTKNTGNYCTNCGKSKKESFVAKEQIEVVKEDVAIKHNEYQIGQIQCQVCENYVDEIYYVEIKEDGDKKYRKICSECMKNYKNIRILNEREIQKYFKD